MATHRYDISTGEWLTINEWDERYPVPERTGPMFNITGLRWEREGKDVTGGRGTKAYVKSMYDKARAAGRPDPEPMNSEAAKYAPAAGVLGNTKKYKEANNGL